MPFVGENLTAIQTLLNGLWNVLSSLFNGVSSVLAVIVGNPLLLIPTGIAFGYVCVKIVRRFIISF